MTNCQPTTTRNETTDWNSINWTRMERIVRQTQGRISRAASSGDWSKVTELQRLLVNSFAAKVIATRDVTTNDGARTPGVDRELWETPAKKMAGALSLTKKEYQPKPLRRVYIDKGKGDGSKRPLGIPTIRDRAMQRLYALSLEPVAEATSDRCSYGFRKGRSAKDAGEHIFIAMAAYYRAGWVLEADIKGFFDHISHPWMIQNIPMDKEVLTKFLKAGFVESGQLFTTEEGTPQGGVISPILANMVLDGLENLLLARFPRKRGHNVNLVRYADDFIVTGATKEICEEVKEIIEPFLRERGVELSQEKTTITHIDDGFDFLGWNFRKYAGKLLIKPSKKAIKKLLAKVRKIIKENPTISQRELIRLLNPVLSGWRNYHNHVVAKDAFGYVDNALFEALWLWARRRHKNKGQKWIKERYWHRLGNDNWVFYDDRASISKENPRLIRVQKSPIVRHPKLNTSMNPYLDTQYFERRAMILGARRLTGDFRQVWEKQKGQCPICKQPILEHTEAHVHHIWPKEWNGRRAVTNLVYVHTTCHRIYHSKYPVRRNATRLEKLAYVPVAKLSPIEDATRTQQLRENRVLEPDAGKLARPVLRGGCGGNDTSLPD